MMMPGGQSINDRIQAARYSIAGQGLAKSVCKATTEEVIGPKKKHLDYLLHCTNEPNVSIPQMANLLIERTTLNSWVVVFKALVTVHHLMCYGNERFTQYLASSNCSFQLSNFVDKANVQGYDMSTFIRRYAKYLNEKALSYRTVAFDFCKVKRGKDDGVLRTMNADKLLKTLPVLQNQVDALLEFDCTANELTNGVINAAFMLLFRDLIRLFACYNDGIINLLEKYFDMNKKMCRDALDIYKKFLIRMDRVGEFLKVAESVGLDKSEMPEVSELLERCKLLPVFQLGTAPSSLLEALEQHLMSLEGKKGSGAGTPTQAATKPAYLKSAFTALSNTSSSFGTASGKMELNGITLDDSLKKQVLEEEQAALNQHKINIQERRLKELAASPTGPTSGSAQTNPFLTSPQAEPVIDLFDPIPQSASSKASDDLLCLKSNPFADSLMNAPQQSTGGSTAFQNNFWGGQQNGFSSATTPTSSTNAFVSDHSFAAAFGNESNSNSTSGSSSMPAAAPGFDSFGDILQPSGGIAQMQPTAQNIQTKTTGSKVITGDLDSSLSMLAQNLNINRGSGSMQKFDRGGHVWNSPKNTSKTGGANWAPQIASSTAAWNSPQHAFNKAPVSSMIGAPTGAKSADWASGMGTGGGFPQASPVPAMGQPMMGGPRPMGPAIGGGPAGMGMAAPMSQQPIGQQPLFSAMPQMPAQQPQTMGFGAAPSTGQPATQLDPFGAL